MEIGMEKTGTCSVEAVLSLLGGKWKGMVVYQLMRGPLRYSELKEPLLGCSERTLSKQLRELEKDGFIRKETLEADSQATGYKLTELGESLRPLIVGMEAWGLRFLDKPSSSQSRISPQDAIVCLRRTGSLPQP